MPAFSLPWKRTFKIWLVLILLVAVILPVTRRILFPDQQYQLDTLKLGMDFKHDITLVVNYFHIKSDLNTFPIQFKVEGKNYEIDWVKPDILQITCPLGSIEKIKLNKDKREHHEIAFHSGRDFWYHLSLSSPSN